MLEESGAAEVIRKQRAIALAPRPTPRELPDPQTEGAGRGEETESAKHMNRKRNVCEKLSVGEEGWGAEGGDERERAQREKKKTC